MASSSAHTPGACPPGVWCFCARKVGMSKTTFAGVFGLLGTALAAVGTAYSTKPWGQVLVVVGLALKGADSLGNMASQDQQ
jgi:hypothetical protein